MLKYHELYKEKEYYKDMYETTSKELQDARDLIAKLKNELANASQAHV